MLNHIAQTFHIHTILITMPKIQESQPPSLHIKVEPETGNDPTDNADDRQDRAPTPSGLSPSTSHFDSDGAAWVQRFTHVLKTPGDSYLAVDIEQEEEDMEIKQKDLKSEFTDVQGGIKKEEEGDVDMTNISEAQGSQDASPNLQTVNTHLNGIKLALSSYRFSADRPDDTLLSRISPTRAQLQSAYNDSINGVARAGSQGIAVSTNRARSQSLRVFKGDTVSWADSGRSPSSRVGGRGSRSPSPYRPTTPMIRARDQRIWTAFLQSLRSFVPKASEIILEDQVSAFAESIVDTLGTLRPDLVSAQGPTLLPHPGQQE